MIDAILIEQCADQSLKPAIIRRFVEEAGTDDPLAITVSAGNRVILTPKPANVEEAMTIVKNHLGQAAVRVGITQYPAGLGISDPSELDPQLFATCPNVAMGTELFGRVYRIVTAWYGSEPEEAFEDAILAWRSGWFEGRSVFHEPERGAPADELEVATIAANDGVESRPLEDAQSPTPDEWNPNTARIRVDLSRLAAEASE